MELPGSRRRGRRTKPEPSPPAPTPAAPMQSMGGITGNESVPVINRNTGKKVSKQNALSQKI